MQLLASKRSFEHELLTLPFDQMLEAFKAIEELDLYLLKRYEDEGDAASASAWKEQMLIRKANRERLVCFRRSLEGQYECSRSH